MKWGEMSAQHSSIQRTLDLVGEKWTLLILRDAVNGVRRFDDFHRHIGMSEAVLADRLRKLTAAGILEGVPYREPGRRTRREYRLTRRGWELWPVLIALMQWGDAHAAGPDGPPVALRHSACGAPVHAVIACTRGHTALSPADVTARPRPVPDPPP